MKAPNLRAPISIQYIIFLKLFFCFNTFLVAQAINESNVFSAYPNATQVKVCKLQKYDSKTPLAFFESIPISKMFVNENIAGLLKDSKGYLWAFSTHGGLIRFDGIKYKFYKHNPSNPNSLPDNNIFDFFEHPKSKAIWLATSKGVFYFDPNKETVKAINKSHSYSTIMADKLGQIWAGTRQNSKSGLLFYDTLLKQMRYFKPSILVEGYSKKAYSGMRINEVSDIIEDDKGVKWVLGIIFTPSKNYKEALIKIAKDSVVFYDLDQAWSCRPLKLAGQKIKGNRIFWDKSRASLWISTNNGVVTKFSPMDQTWKHYPTALGNLLENPVNEIVFQPNGDKTQADDLWLTTYEGLKRLRPETSELWSNFSRKPKEDPEGESGYFTGALRDEHGILWFGAERKMLKMDPYHQQLQQNHVFPDSFRAQAMVHCPQSGELILAQHHASGILQIIAFNPQTGKLRQAIQRVSLSPIDACAVKDLFVAPDGRIWMSLNPGLGWLDLKTLHFQLPNLSLHSHYAPQERSNAVAVWKFTADEKGDIWMPTFGHCVLQYSTKDQQIYAHEPEGSSLDLYPNNRFNTNLLIDKKGNFWLGNNGYGLQLWNPITRKTKEFHAIAGKEHSLAGNFVMAIYEDETGGIWLGTEAGLSRYIPNLPDDQSFKRIPGINTFVFRIIEDAAHRLWVTTQKGLCCYDAKNQVVRYFNAKDGIVHPEIYAPLLKENANSVWFGNLYNFNLNKIKLFAPTADPQIIAFSIDNHAVNMPKTGTPNFYLSPKAQVFTVQFGTLGFSAPEETKLYYSLDQGKPYWIAAGAQRKVTFYRQQSGQYQFRLKAVGNGGAQSIKTVAINVFIRSPFYRTIWFYMLITILIVAIIYAIFRYREQQLLEKVNIRQAIARDLHDEMGSTLSSISILSDAAQSNAYQEIDTQSLKVISARTREVMDTMSDIVWSINPYNDAFAEVLQRMRGFAAETLEAKNIDLQFIVEEPIQSLVLSMNQRKDFYRIFKEAINNAAKYAKAKQVWVKINGTDKIIHLEIKDDGQGFDPENVKLGNGIQNMQARAARLRGNFVINSSLGNGVTISLSFPIT